MIYLSLRLRFTGLDSNLMCKEIVRGIAESDYAVFMCDARKFGDAADLQLIFDVLLMEDKSPQRDTQIVADLFAAHARSHKPKDFHLAPRQHFQRVRSRRCGIKYDLL